MQLQLLQSPQKYLFWSAPADFTGDFVIEDPLAFDYLSQQVGYWLFGGLTTRTSRAQYVALVLYGLSLVEEVLQGKEADDELRKRLFERWERFWALAVFESRGGEFERSDDDAIRGQRGAKRAWREGADSLPLDFKLIGRQSELGALGAYLSALRNEATNLVVPGTLRPSSLARGIIEAFWGEPGSGTKVSAYHDYAQLSLELDRKNIPRKYGAITLHRVGQMSRLTALTTLGRTEQQARLWRVLFENATDDTLRFAQLVQEASTANVFDSREIIEQALGGKFGTFNELQRDKLTVAIAFGDVQRELLSAFNRAYAVAFSNGWKVSADKAAEAVAGGAEGAALRDACSRLLHCPMVARFHALPMHGKAFVNLAATLSEAAASSSLDALVLYHASIHRERRHATPWFRLDSGRLLIDVGAYGARSESEGAFPSLKLNVVRSLLRDLGRLS